MNQLRKILREYPAARILDVGTGVGNFVALLGEADDGFAEIVGIDTSANAVNAAKNHFATDPRIRFERMDALAMTFPDATFDIVCLSNTLHHLADAGPVFAAMRRVLKPGGVVIVNEMVADGLDERQVSHRELHHFAAAIDRSLGIVHDDTYARAVILDTLGRVGGLPLRASWNVVFPPSPEPSAAEVEALAGNVDRLLARIPDEDRRKDFRVRSEEVKAYIRNHGYAAATQLMVVLGGREDQ